MREARLDVGGESWRLDLEAGTPISIRLQFDGDQPNAFHLPRARSEVVEADGFVGDTERSGSVNCETVTLTPHGNGTHTESIGHVVDRDVPIGARVPGAFLPTSLLSVPSTRLDETPERYDGEDALDDRVITRSALARADSRVSSPTDFLQGLVVRTRPNDPDKRTRRHSGTNPPYPTTDAVAWMRDRGVRHLVVDLPSIDRESDGGETPNHRTFWNLAPRDDGGDPREECTVTEMAFVPDALEDGHYVLNLQIPDFELDAAPSRPVLFDVRGTAEDMESE